MKKISIIVCIVISIFHQLNLQAQPYRYERTPDLTIPTRYNKPYHRTENNAKIQVAILLDVSNSMDGLIDQAKAQLWNTVTTLGRTHYRDGIPQIELAFYEFGRETNSRRAGYVKQLSGFSTNLDYLSSVLFNVTTNGGDEFCTQAIYTSLTELNWDNNPNSYKVIFICGNESFLQGPDLLKRVCVLAKQKSVIINTIYCGDRMEGIREHWKLLESCGGGSYTFIDQNEKQQEIHTPYDEELITLNDQLNQTYVYYGNRGQAYADVQKNVDSKNRLMSKSVYVKRIEAKGIKSLYKNEEWDLVDKMEKDPNIIQKINKNQLADSLQKKTTAQLEQSIKLKAKQRAAIQQKIAEKTKKRNEFIANEKRKSNTNNGKATMETEVEKIIRKQAALKGMKTE
jgi:hypothetical protein